MYIIGDHFSKYEIKIQRDCLEISGMDFYHVLNKCNKSRE